jgi:hypothetical protein
MDSTSGKHALKVIRVVIQNRVQYGGRGPGQEGRHKGGAVLGAPPGGSLSVRQVHCLCPASLAPRVTHSKAPLKV